MIFELNNFIETPTWQVLSTKTKIIDLIDDSLKEWNTRHP